MLVDFHSHTTASDGVLTPTELVLRAVDKRVQALAITDHDTTAGIAEAQRVIEAQDLPLILVNGVEISCGWENYEIHVVGLRFDQAHPAMLALLQTQQEKREVRALEIGRRLAKANIPDAYDGAKALAGDGQITRAHFARYMVAQNYVDSFQKVFNKYLTRGNPGYVPNNWVSIAEAIDTIHQAGGVAVLAHPAHYKLSNKWLRRLLVAFKEAGGDAMEVATAQQAPQERINLGQWSREYGLLASQGSDFHAASPWRELGRNLYLPKDATAVWQNWSELAAS